MFRLGVGFFLLIIHLASGQVPYPRQCPEVKVVESFNLDSYLGIWYEYSRYPFVFEFGQKCACAHYSYGCKNLVAVTNEAINRFTENPTNVTGTAKTIAPGQLAVVFNKHQNPDKANYLVLGTDYTSYAVVYSCTEMLSIAHTRIVWILTRERLPKQETVDTALKVLDDNNISQTFLMQTAQENCTNCQPLPVQETCDK